MKRMSMINHIIVGLLAAAMLPSCALEADLSDDPEHAEAQAALELNDPDGAADEAITIEATPTCNTVTNWSNAAVPAFSGTGSVNCNMVQTCHSSAVGQLQFTYNQCFAKPRRLAFLVVDNDYGPKTKAAVVRMQQAAGINDDGEYGPVTRRSISHPSNEVPNRCVRVP